MPARGLAQRGGYDVVPPAIETELNEARSFEGATHRAIRLESLRTPSDAQLAAGEMQQRTVQQDVESHQAIRSTRPHELSPGHARRMQREPHFAPGPQDARDFMQRPIEMHIRKAHSGDDSSERVWPERKGLSSGCREVVGGTPRPAQPKCLGVDIDAENIGTDYTGGGTASATQIERSDVAGGRVDVSRIISIQRDFPLGAVVVPQRSLYKV